VFDTRGNRMTTLHVNAQKGLNSQKIDFSKMGSGVYIVRTVIDKRTFVVRAMAIK